MSIRPPEHGDEAACAFCGGTKIRYIAKGAANPGGGHDLVSSDWVHVVVVDGEEQEIMADHAGQPVIEWQGPVP